MDLLRLSSGSRFAGFLFILASIIDTVSRAENDTTAPSKLSAVNRAVQLLIVGWNVG
jgi:hypothetical protein